MPYPLPIHIMHTRMHDLAVQDRPREKLKTKGVQALTDFELLQVMIGSGTKGADVGTIALALQREIRKVGIDGVKRDRLQKIPGMSTGKTSLMLAALEFVRRQTEHDETKIESPEDVLPLVHHLREKKQEHLIALILDGANTVLSQRTITMGTLNASLIHPREVFADAIRERAASIVLVHNHPSGELQPSEEDKRITKVLMHAGALLGIPVLDHLIVTKTGWISLGMHGILDTESADAPLLLQSPEHFHWFFRSENNCLEYLFELKIGRATCPNCKKSGAYSKHPTRPCYSCTCGQHHVFPRAGTIFEGSSIPLTRWFRGIYMFCKKDDVRAEERAIKIGISQPTAERMREKIMAVLPESSDDVSPEGRFLKCLERVVQL